LILITSFIDRQRWELNCVIHS